MWDLPFVSPQTNCILNYLLVAPLPLKMWRFVVILQFRQNTFFAVCLSWFLFSDKSICSCLMSCQSSLFTSVGHLCPQVCSRPIGIEENRPMRIRDRLHLKSTSACFCCQVMPAASLFVCKREGGSVWSAENDFSISFSHDPPSSRLLRSMLGNFQCSRRGWKTHWSRFQIKPISWILLTSPISKCPPGGPAQISDNGRLYVLAIPEKIVNIV